MVDPPAKKRVSLPVLGEKKPTLLEKAELGDESAGERSPVAWIGLGTMATFVALVPLAMLAMLGAHAIANAKGVSSGVATAGLVAVAIVTLALSSWAGGYLVGRFGGKAGVREGALSGAVVGLILWP